MQNDYLNNKKNFDRSKKEKVVKKNLFNLDPKTNKNVDINKLLNRVKMDEKNKESDGKK